MRDSSFASRIFAWVAIVLASFCGGCGGDEYVAIAGTAWHQGKPLPGLFVFFEGTDQQSSWATTNDDGRFNLVSNGGRIGTRPGMHRVWVDYRPTEPSETDGEKELARIAALKTQLEEKYGRETSRYTIKITRSTNDLSLTFD